MTGDDLSQIIHKYKAFKIGLMCQFRFSLRKSSVEATTMSLYEFAIKALRYHEVKRREKVPLSRSMSYYSDTLETRKKASL